jgi:hypothetical protein
VPPQIALAITVHLTKIPSPRPEPDESNPGATINKTTAISSAIFACNQPQDIVHQLKPIPPAEQQATYPGERLRISRAVREPPPGYRLGSSPLHFIVNLLCQQPLDLTTLNALLAKLGPQPMPSDAGTSPSCNPRSGELIVVN